MKPLNKVPRIWSWRSGAKPPFSSRLAVVAGEKVVAVATVVCSSSPTGLGGEGGKVLRVTLVSVRWNWRCSSRRWFLPLLVLAAVEVA
jgi:hypothetical protein